MAFKVVGIQISHSHFQGFAYLSSRMRMKYFKGDGLYNIEIDFKGKGLKMSFETDTDMVEINGEMAICAGPFRELFGKLYKKPRSIGVKVTKIA